MKKVGSVIAVVIAVGIGFFVRGLMPSGSAPAGAAGQRPTMPPPAVKVIETTLEAASPVAEYIAHVEPIQQVNLMAQVEGVIEEVHFKEGSRVKQGDLLFTLDPAPYAANVAQRKAELEQANASLARAVKYLAMLNAADNRSVSKSDLDAAEANTAEGRAMVHKAEAALQQAEIDLSYTRITSPIDGRIGRALITRGNLVSPASGSLATVIQIDPVRVVFAMPDAEYLDAFIRYSTDTNYEPKINVRLGNGEMLAEQGEIDFDDNQMNPATGTIAIRMRFPNPQRLLVANNFVTVLVQDGHAPRKVLVPSESVMHDADGTYVWCVNEDNTVEQVYVETGEVIGTRQIIESGLESGRRVMFAGMQKVRPGMTVAPQVSAKSE
ncbi:efflux RND transporter periplasmic adaptor subunit [Pontiellaceae bacterium B12219]|nr:efflux RND transporter periplasmic adaptor subunit [Pontiellaceae bacterium B12219]